MSFPERIRYGAAELRRFYNRNLFMALGISIAVHLALIGLYLTSTDEVIAGSDVRPGDTITWVKLIPDEVPPENDVIDPVEPPTTSGPEISGTAVPFVPEGGPAELGGAALGGEPQPVDDGSLSPEDGNFAPLDVLATADPNGKGNGGDPNGKKDGSGVPPVQGGGGGGDKPATQPVDEIPNDFPDPDVELPDVDLAELSSRAEYPRMARENGIEGRVTVKVLIGEDGRALRTSIEQSAAAVLDSAAIRAVRQTIFKPATLNGMPVKAWLFLPVNFTLDN